MKNAEQINVHLTNIMLKGRIQKTDKRALVYYGLLNNEELKELHACDVCPLFALLYEKSLRYKADLKKAREHIDWTLVLCIFLIPFMAIFSALRKIYEIAGFEKWFIKETGKQKQRQQTENV